MSDTAEARAPRCLERIVVVGGGLAGLESVVALRNGGHAGVVTLVSAERHLPYDRPPLSKEILRGEADDSNLEADWPALDVELKLDCHATGLDDGVLETDRGRLDHDGLVIATGAAPLALKHAAPGVTPLVLRTIDDALALRAHFAQGARVAIVGAGWIGAEVATAAAAAGCEVVVIEAGDAPLCGALPVEIGRMTERWYAEAGIALRLGAAVTAVEEGVVHLADGRTVPADCVVVGIGVRPDTSWLQGSSVVLGPRGHVLVDASLRTSLPGVVAVGDCTAWESRLFETTLSVEHWDNALRAPAVAAANLIGGDEAYDPVPYFWSEQFGRMVQYAGHQVAADALIMRGEPSSSTWTVCSMRDERLVAALTVGRPRDIAHARRMIARRVPLDPSKLSDPAVRILDAAA